MLKAIAGMSIALVLTACASGTALVVGDKRPPTNPKLVKIYTKPPTQPYDTIALVKSTGKSGWTQQQKLDYAMQEIKEQAAAVGANGIILTGAGTQVGGYTGIGNSFGTGYANSFSSFGLMSGAAIRYETVSGEAIFVK